MSYPIKYGGPLVKNIYVSTNTAGRTSDNPAFPKAYNTHCPEQLRRVYCLIQNTSAGEINITLNSAGTTLKLYAGQSISLDNYTGPVSASGTVTIAEAFA
jgi:hypothetical protein